MASTSGLSAWKKYFQGKGEMETTLKKSSATFLENGKPGPLLHMGSLVKILPLENEVEYLSYVRGKSTGPNVNAYIPIKYQNKTLLCSFNDMSKAKEGKIADLKLQTVNLVKGAEKQKFNFMGYEDIECVVFSNVDEMRKIVLPNIQRNILLNQVIPFKECLKRYFESNTPEKIEWMETVGLQEKQQFAKYIGELCIGFALLADKKVISNSNPFIGKKIKSFILPLNESFSGADSFFLLSDNTVITISSKSEVGAAASFFSNILLPAFKNPKYIKGESIFKEFYDTANEMRINDESKLRTGSKKIIYEYGIRNILKISKKDLNDTYKVFEEFKKYEKITDYSVEVRNVYSKLILLMKKEGDETALKNLDSSTTVFFCREIAKLLNEDKASMDIIKNILGGKKLYQANLQTKKLIDNGEIEFKMLLSGDASVKIIGNKSGYSNIDASQGSINYILKYQ